MMQTMTYVAERAPSPLFDKEVPIWAAIQLLNNLPTENPDRDFYKREYTPDAEMYDSDSELATPVDPAELRMGVEDEGLIWSIIRDIEAEVGLPTPPPAHPSEFEMMIGKEKDIVMVETPPPVEILTPTSNAKPSPPLQTARRSPSPRRRGTMTPDRKVLKPRGPNTQYRKQTAYQTGRALRSQPYGQSNRVTKVAKKT